MGWILKHIEGLTRWLSKPQGPKFDPQIKYGRKKGLSQVVLWPLAICCVCIYIYGVGGNKNYNIKVKEKKRKVKIYHDSFASYDYSLGVPRSLHWTVSEPSSGVCCVRLFQRDERYQKLMEVQNSTNVQLVEPMSCVGVTEIRVRGNFQEEKGRKEAASPKSSPHEWQITKAGNSEHNAQPVGSSMNWRCPLQVAQLVWASLRQLACLGFF